MDIIKQNKYISNYLSIEVIDIIYTELIYKAWSNDLCKNIVKQATILPH